MRTLKQARKNGKIKDFIKEHEQDPCGDEDKFNALLDKASHPEKSKSTQETSAQDSSESSSDTQTP